MDRNKDLNKIVRDRNKLRHHSNYHAHHVEMYQAGGRMGSSMASTDDCGPGYHMMPDGTCMVGDYHGASTSGYQRGGGVRRFHEGGPTTFPPIPPHSHPHSATGGGTLSESGMSQVVDFKPGPNQPGSGFSHMRHGRTVGTVGSGRSGRFRRSGRNRSTMRTYQNGGRSTMRTSRRPQVVGVGDHHHELNPQGMAAASELAVMSHYHPDLGQNEFSNAQLTSTYPVIASAGYSTYNLEQNHGGPMVGGRHRHRRGGRPGRRPIRRRR